jgi:hypothetical protein
MPCRIEEFIQAIWSDLISWAGHKAFYYFALPLTNVSCTAVLHNTRKTRLQRRMHAKWIRRRDNRACKMDPRSAICIFSPPMQSAFALYVFLDFQPASLSLSSYPSCISLLGTAAHGMVLRRCPLSCTMASSLYAQLPKKHGTDGRGIFSCSCRRFAGTWRGDAEGGVGQGAGILPDRLLKATPVCLNWLHAFDAPEDEEGWRSTIQMDDPNALAALEITQCKWVMYFPPSMQSAKCITSLDTPGWAQPWINCYIVQFCTSLSHYIRAQMSWFTNC